MLNIFEGWGTCFFLFLFLAPVFTCNQAKFRRGQVNPPYRLFYCWLPTIKRSVGNGLDRSESFRGEHHNKFWLVVCRIFWRPLEGDSPRGGEMSRSDRGDRALFARCLRSRLKGGSTRRAQKFMLPTIHGGQRSLRPQARFGGQPGLKIPAFRPEMATLPRDCQQMNNHFYARQRDDSKHRPLHMICNV